MASHDVVVVAPSAIIDHIAIVDNDQLEFLLGSSCKQLRGSQRYTSTEMQDMLMNLKHLGCNVENKPAGSAANVARNLACQGVSTRLITSCGSDEWGSVFRSQMHAHGVCLDPCLVQPGGTTGSSVILCHSGQRTMRTHICPHTILKPEQLSEAYIQNAPRKSQQSNDRTLDTSVNASMHGLTQNHCTGTNTQGHTQVIDVKCQREGDMVVDGNHACNPAWTFLSAYAAYSPGLLEQACKLSRKAGRHVFLDLASHEVVQRHAAALLQLLREGMVDVVVCNEDEAQALSSCLDAVPTMQDVLEPPQDNGHNSHFRHNQACHPDIIKDNEWMVARCLSSLCYAVIVTLGSRGCLVLQGDQVHHQPAVGGVQAIDSTGAGDAFTSGFLTGLVKGLPIQQCAQLGCAVGAAAVQILGPEIPQKEWAKLASLP